MNKSFTVAKTNFMNMKLAYIITAIVVLCLVAQDIVYVILALFDVYPGAESMPVGIGNYFYLVIILGAIFIPTLNFRKMVNLGAKRNDFFVGCFVNYLITAAAVSLISIILYYTYEQFIIDYYMDSTLNVLYWFKWLEHGPVVAFFQQFAFLFLAASFIHTLTAAQTKWYGWVADVILIAVISVFIPIAPLRSALVWFFNLIIFQSNALLQVLACLGLGTVIYALNKPMLSKKII